MIAKVQFFLIYALWWSFRPALFKYHVNPFAWLAVGIYVKRFEDAYWEAVDVVLST